MLVCSVFDSNYRFIQNLILNIMNKYYKRYKYNEQRKKEVCFILMFYDQLRFDDEARDELRFFR